MRNLPYLPKCKREGSKKGGCHTISKPRTWWAAAGQLPAPAADTMGRPQHCCLLSHRAVTQSMPAGYPHYLQQVLQKQPSKVSAVHSPVQTCSKQTAEMQHLAAQQNKANRSSECKGRKENKIRKKKRTTSSFQHLAGPRVYPGFPLCITSANNQCLLSAAWSTNPGVRLPNSMQNHVR